MQTELQVNLVSVLVVEDDREISRLLKHNLENENTKVVEVATDLDCIELIYEVRNEDGIIKGGAHAITRARTNLEQRAKSTK
jgi:CheY-like chemotaxis protein